MVLGVFHNTFDWTAIGTLALAVATFVALVFTRRSLKQSQEEIALSRREVQEAHRPVVVPLADRRQMDASYGAAHTKIQVIPQIITSNVLTVPVENIGSGPALNLEASVQWQRGTEMRSVGSGGQQPAVALGLRASGRIALDIRIADLDETLPRFGLKLTYADVAGKVWTTVALYEHEHYEDLSMFSLEDSEMEGPPTLDNIRAATRKI